MVPCHYGAVQEEGSCNVGGVRTTESMPNGDFGRPKRQVSRDGHELDSGECSNHGDDVVSQRLVLRASRDGGGALRQHNRWAAYGDGTGL